MTKFSDWLTKQLHSRELSAAQLARLMHKDQGVVSRLLRGERGPSTDTLDAVAHALRLPVEEVYRSAGVLPAAQSDQWVEKQSHRLSLITDPVVRKTVENIIDSIAQQEEASRKAKGAKLKRILE